MTCRKLLPPIAFGNEVAQTDDTVIVGATYVSAPPHSKQMINSYLITFLGGCRSFHSVGRTLRICYGDPDNIGE